MECGIKLAMILTQKINLTHQTPPPPLTVIHSLTISYINTPTHNHSILDYNTIKRNISGSDDDNNNYDDDGENDNDDDYHNDNNTTFFYINSLTHNLSILDYNTIKRHILGSDDDNNYDDEGDNDNDDDYHDNNTTTMMTTTTITQQ